MGSDCSWGVGCADIFRPTTCKTNGKEVILLVKTDQCHVVIRWQHGIRLLVGCGLCGCLPANSMHAKWAGVHCVCQKTNVFIGGRMGSDCWWGVGCADAFRPTACKTNRTSCCWLRQTKGMRSLDGSMGSECWWGVGCADAFRPTACMPHGKEVILLVKADQRNVVIGWPHGRVQRCGPGAFDNEAWLGRRTACDLGELCAPTSKIRGVPVARRNTTMRSRDSQTRCHRPS